MADLTFAEVAAINRMRCARWHGGFPSNTDGFTGADWANAMQGEAGEAGNVVKKLRRHELGIQQNAESPDKAVLLAKLATEIGDTFMYLDLLAQHYGLHLAACVADTFNRVSEREGFPERIRPADKPIAGDTYNGHTITAYEVPGSQDARVELRKGSELVREFVYPMYRVWTLIAHWRESDEVNQPEPSETAEASS